MQAETPFLLDELGALQFERLCLELLRLDAGGMETRPWGLSLLVHDGAVVAGGGRLDGPTLVLVAWIRNGATAASAPLRLRHLVEDALVAWEENPARSLLVLTNVADAAAAAPDDVPSTILGPAELWRLYAADPGVRLRVPSALGVADLAALVPADAARRSTGDIAAAAELARVFVPTQAYLDALRVLRQHHFAVLTGPPEMGKTAIARMIGLAALTDGWELHECVRPDELWSRFARDRRQVFVADDAFGSTEYRPEAAERWAVELPAVLRAMDDRHWLVWTSRPAPLKAGLRRIHREHGVERFPQPVEVGVDTARLDVGEKALVLFRHAKGASLPEPAIALVRAQGWRIVSHPHFTPERIRRFVAGRLRDLADDAGADVDALVSAEIREPTAAMAASYRALAPDQRAVLLALLDAPPGPVSERDLAASIRRHAPSGLAHSPSEVVDRLADHFVRHVEPAAVTWVHPSWRDLVIDELADDAAARRAFLHACGSHGAALALSTAGGATGERSLPLLRDDADWDATADRLVELVPGLEPPEVTVLLAALAEARSGADGAARAELDALSGEVLGRLARVWGAVPVGLLAAWLALASELPERPELPALVSTWIELVPAGPVDLRSAAETASFDDWTALAELLGEHDPELLSSLGFPAGHMTRLGAYIRSVEAALDQAGDLETTETVARTLARIGRLVPGLAFPAYDAANRLQTRSEVKARAAANADRVELRPLSPELERLLEQPFVSRHRDESLVARVLRDL